jgi:hypothetical protein
VRVLFSAAIPGDYLRALICNDPAIERWYRHNMLL